MCGQEALMTINDGRNNFQKKEFRTLGVLINKREIFHTETNLNVWFQAT